MNAIGYSWLAMKYGIETVQHGAVRTRVGPSRSTVARGSFEQRVVPAALEPAGTLRGHLTFALKHEGTEIEFLSRLFATVEPDELATWIGSEPTSMYARRACFIYEWLVPGRRLPVGNCTRGNYVDILDKDQYVTALIPSVNSRWRVRDNFLGTSQFCPMVARTTRVDAILGYNIAERVKTIRAEIGDDYLVKSAIWLTLNESKASFAIEREEDATRIRRFAAVIEAESGRNADPLAVDYLAFLQREITAQQSSGFRQSPVFAGESLPHGANVVHYIAPRADQIEGLMQGLAGVLHRTEGISSILRAALVSFGFVYIHPMPDGNGRISRFLINDIFRRDGAVPEPLVLPVSVVLQGHKLPDGYDAILEVLAKPLMRRYSRDYRFGDIGECVTYPDGVDSDFLFSGYDDALHAWRFPDLTRHVQYIGDVVRFTIENELLSNARYYQRFVAARAAVKEVLDYDNARVDKIIRSIVQNEFVLGTTLQRDIPALGDPGIGKRIVARIKEAYEVDHPEPDEGERERSSP